ASALEELRMLSNFQLGERALLQTYLIGQPQFRQVLASEGFEQLRQRVIASYHVAALDAAETRSYIEHRLRRVGWQNDPSFDDDVFRLIYEHTGGVPRRINLLCERLLLWGCLEERHHIDVATAEEVLRELREEGSPLVSSVPSSAPAGLLIDDSTDTIAIAREVAALSERTNQLQSILNAQRKAGDGVVQSEMSANGAGALLQSREPGRPGKTGPFETGPNGSGNKPIGDVVAREVAHLTGKAAILEDHLRTLERRLRLMLSSLGK
ncbi:MAG: hypothetical protein ACREUU_02165, partial [Gammaproteobacteria bacterium]